MPRSVRQTRTLVPTPCNLVGTPRRCVWVQLVQKVCVILTSTVRATFYPRAPQCGCRCGSTLTGHWSRCSRSLFVSGDMTVRIGRRAASLATYWWYCTHVARDTTLEYWNINPIKRWFIDRSGHKEPNYLYWTKSDYSLPVPRELLLYHVSHQHVNLLILFLACSMIIHT